jgi:hypothetical protein
MMNLHELFSHRKPEFAQVTASDCGSDVGDRTSNRNGLAWNFTMTPG